VRKSARGTRARRAGHLDDEVHAIIGTETTETVIAACPWAYLRLVQGMTRVGR